MRPRSFNHMVQGVASDALRKEILLQFVTWDEDHGHVIDVDGIVHRWIVVMIEDVDGTNQRIGNANANPCAVGEQVPRSMNVTCLACLARGPVQPRKQP